MHLSAVRPPKTPDRQGKRHQTKIKSGNLKAFAGSRTTDQYFTRP